MISTEVVAGRYPRAERGRMFCAISCVPKPEVCTPRAASAVRRHVPAVAMPLPKSALATVPLFPFAPPDPLPCPGPTGMSNDARSSGDQFTVRLAGVAWLQSIGIAEAAGLHFLDRSVHGRRYRTPRKITGMNEHRARRADEPFNTAGAKLFITTFGASTSCGSWFWSANFCAARSVWALETRAPAAAAVLP